MMTVSDSICSISHLGLQSHTLEMEPLNGAFRILTGHHAAKRYPPAWKDSNLQIFIASLEGYVVF